MATFVVPSAPAKQEQFKFKVARPRPWLFLGLKKSYSVPLIQNLPAEVRKTLQATVQGVTDKNLTEAKAKRIWDAQLAVLERYAPGVVARHTDEQLLPLMQAWYAASGISMGESSASSTS